MQSNLAGLSFVSLTNFEISANWSPSFPTPFKAHHITQAALQEGLVPDDETLVTMAENPGFVGGDRKLEDLRWPDEPLRAALLSEPLGIGEMPVGSSMVYIASGIRLCFIGAHACLRECGRLMVSSPSSSLQQTGSWFSPLHAHTTGGVTVLGVGRFAKKYPAVLQALLKSLVQVVCQYQKTGEWEEANSGSSRSMR